MKRIGILFGSLLGLPFFFTHSTTAQPIPPTNGLVGWWRGETNGLDSSVKGHHGNLLSGVGFDDGKFGKAFSFAGNVNRVYVPDTQDLMLTNSLSIAAWIYPKANCWHVMERAGSAGGSYTYSFGLDNAGKLMFLIHDFAGPSQVITAPISLNQWSHVACSLEGATGDMRLYINSVEVAYTNTPVRPTGVINPAWQPGVGIGNSAVYAGWPFIGLIDEVVLYSRALAPEEIGALAVIEPPSLAIALYPGLTLKGEIGRAYAIQFATNVNSLYWSNLTTITLTQSSQLWVDTDANVNSGTRPQRFYRAILLP